MSIEIEAELSDTLHEQSLPRLKNFVHAQTQLKFIRDQGNELGLAASANGPEIITVVMKPQRIYIAFHAFPRPSREAFLQVLKAWLLHEGIAATRFEEL